ncbi:hypothetical protein ACQP2X_17530 [Actinoplanes sp. CA-131856]
MSQPNGDLWVRPEGVSQLGNTYASHAAMYEQHLNQLNALRSQYSNAWGNDDMGNQFSAKFLEGMSNLENLIGAVKGGLDYTATGLRQSGHSYREADDDAKDASHKLDGAFNNLSANPGGGGGGGGGAVAPDISSAARPNSGGPATASLRTGTTDTPPTGAIRASTGGASPAASLRTGETDEPPGGVPRNGESAATPPATLRSGETTAAPGPSGPAPADTPPVRTSVPGPENAATPRVPFDPATHTNLLADGKTPPEGYRVTAFAAENDGTVRFDANQYDAVAPLAYTPVTDAHGSPVEPGDGKHFFLVKDAPETATARTPMYVSIPAAGH